MRIRGYEDTRIQGCKDARMQGCKDTRIRGYVDTRMRGYEDTRIRGYKDARIRGSEDIYLLDMLVMLFHQDPLACLHRGQGPETRVYVDEPLAQVLHPKFLQVWFG